MPKQKQQVIIRAFKPLDMGLGPKGIFLEIRNDTKLLGKLKIGNANLEWIEPGCSHGKRRNWQEIRKFILERGHSA